MYMGKYMANETLSSNTKNDVPLLEHAHLKSDLKENSKHNWNETSLSWIQIG